jgi:copper chaperone NosL
MAISEEGYASELIDVEQRVYKFDDIGCMLRFARDRRLAGSREVHVFVRDYDGRDWMRGEDAHYVQSPQIPSPMASGIIAAADRPRAERHAAKFQGRVLAFAEIWKP